MARAFAPRRIRPVKAAWQLYHQLKEDIVAGRLATGDLLPPVDLLGEQAGLSRPTVREAMALLENQGLVRPRRGRNGGAVVLRPAHESATRTLGDLFEFENATLVEFFEVRQLLEPAAARLAAQRIRPDELAHLAQTIEGLKGSLRDPDGWADHGAAFHIGIAAASRNPVLRTFVDALRTLISRYARGLDWTDEVRNRGIAQHAEIYEHLAGGRAEQAERAMAAHLCDPILRSSAAEGACLDVASCLSTS